MSSNKNGRCTRGFTIIELIVGICIAIILVGGIGLLIRTLENNLTNVGFLEKAITEKEDWEKDVRDLTKIFPKILTESGTTFTKTNVGFENVVYTNQSETGGIIIGVLDYDANTIIIGTDYFYKKYLPFIAVLSAAEITAAKANYTTFIGSFPGKKKIYYNLPIVSLGHYKLNNGGEKYDMNFTLIVYKELIGKNIYEVYSNKDFPIFSLSLVQ